MCFLPCSVTIEQHNQHVALWVNLLEMFKTNLNFHKKMITDGKSLCFTSDVEAKCPVFGKTSPKPERLGSQKLRIKMLLIDFFNSKLVIWKEFLNRGTTINAVCYHSISWIGLSKEFSEFSQKCGSHKIFSCSVTVLQPTTQQLCGSFFFFFFFEKSGHCVELSSILSRFIISKLFLVFKS